MVAQWNRRQQLIVVESFMQRNFVTASSSSEKQVVLKVIGSGSSKKPKVPVKTCIKGVLKALVEDEDPNVMVNTGKEEPMDLSEVEMARVADPPKLDLGYRTGTPCESRK
jgi:hypothetical protein